MHNSANALSLAVAATLGATAAESAVIPATLKSVVTYSGNAVHGGDLSSATATWIFDTVSGLLTQAGGTFNVRVSITPTTTIFRHVITGLVLGGGASATAAAFNCVEGNFGATIGASICGNYDFGGNFDNESTAAWGPGTNVTRTIGGDDNNWPYVPPPPQTGSYWNPTGAPQSIQDYDGFATLGWVGTTLVLSNARCDPAAPGNANGCATLGGFNRGYTWTLEAVAVPVPAAGWLLGGALALLGLARRRLAGAPGQGRQD